MTDRTVKVALAAATAGYDGPIVASSKVTADFGMSQKAAAAEAKAAAAQAVAGAQAIAAAEKVAATAAKDAAATATSANQAVTAAQKEASLAAKEAASAETASAKAVTDEEIAAATAAKEAAAQRVAAAEAGVSAAQKDAASATEAAASAKEFALSQRDIAAASKEAATAAKASAGILAEVAAQEATEAKASASAAAERSAAYKEAGSATTKVAAGTAVAVGLMVKSAGDFKSATEHLVTDAGELPANLGMVQAGILKTATATGTSASALVDAMYHIESAGNHGADGLTILTTAAEGAKVGNADLGVTAKALTGTLNAYNMTGDKSVSMMNQLIATVGAGDMKMNDLGASLGSVVAVGASAGLTYSQIGGAVATMTAQNMTADRATQDLSNTISNLQNPSQVAITQMQQLGLNSNDVSSNLGKRGLTGTLDLLTTAVASHIQNGQVFIDTLKNSQNAAADADTMLKQLPPSIQDISKKLLDGAITAAEYNKGISGLDAPQQHMAKQFEALVKSSGSFNDLLKSGKPDAETYNAALAKMLGGTTGLNTVLMLSGPHMKAFKDNTAAIQAAADKGGTSVDNWGKIQGTFNQKVDVAKASLGAMGIAIGSTLLPPLAEMAKWVAGIVAPIAEWTDKHQGLTLAIAGTATGLAALILLVKAAVKTYELVKVAVTGVSTALQFFSRDAEAAAVKTEAMSAANKAAAAETEAASVSTSGLVGKLGGAVPALGAVALGAVALGEKLGQMAGVGDHTGQSITDLTKQLLDMNQGLPGSTAQMQGMAVAMAIMGRDMHTTVQGTKDLDKSVADLVSGGHPQQAAVAFGAMQDALVKQGFSLGYINDQLFPQYNKALVDASNAQREAAMATDGNTKAVGDSTGAAQGATDAATALGQATSATAKTATAATASAYQAAAASRAQADAQRAEADGVSGAATAHSGATTATAGHAAVTKDATAAAKDNTAAAKADALAAKDNTKANTDLGKSITDGTTIAKAGATATKDAAAAAAAAADKAKADAAAAKENAAANATAADKHAANAAAAKASAAAHAASTAANKANATSSHDQAAAVRDAAAAAAAGDRANAAAAKSVDAHTKAVDAQAKAAAAASKAAGEDAAAQAAAAEQAKEAAQEHDLGTTALKAWAAAASDTAHSADQLDTSVGDEVAAMKDAQAQANTLKDAMDALNGVHINAGKAALDVQGKIADLTKTLHDNGTTLDITTQKGRDNMTQVYDLATAINAHAQAVTQETGSVDAGNKTLDASRAEFDAVLKSAGVSKDAIDSFNKTLLQTPKMQPVSISLDTSDALNKLATFRDMAGKPIYVQYSGTTVKAAFATGGLIQGPGTETSDSVPIMASRNEFILNAAATAAIGVDNLTRLNAAHGQAGTIVRPQLIQQVGGTTPQPAASGGSPLHIEHYYEASGGGAHQTAAELSWLLHARGIAA